MKAFRPWKRANGEKGKGRVGSLVTDKPDHQLLNNQGLLFTNCLHFFEHPLGQQGLRSPRDMISVFQAYIINKYIL